MYALAYGILLNLNLTMSALPKHIYNVMEQKNVENKAPSLKENRSSAEEADPNNRNGDQKPSLMVRKFLKGGAFIPPPDRDNYTGFRPTYFFFYGSLMDNSQLRKILQLEDKPVLQPASIVGWETKLWGQYPALTFKANAIAHGMACEVQKEEQVEYLKSYETDVYKVKGCKIKFVDGRELYGKTFVWNAENKLLKEGKFDLKDWQLAQLEKQQ
ncbi:hypothetical protein WAI453_009961 [Rhynchosporium graminicola]